MRHLMSAMGITLVAFALGATVLGQNVLWLEAESREKTEGTVIFIDATKADFGRMAKADASGESFIALVPGAKVTLPPVEVQQAGERAVWVRAFPLAGRCATVLVDGKAVGTTAGTSTEVALVWQRVGVVRLDAGKHAVELHAADGNTNAAYVDVIALLTDLNATPIGRSPEDIVSGPKTARLVEDFAGETAESLSPRWKLRPPPGEDASVEMAPKEDDGALRIHNGAGEAFSLVSRQPLDVRPGDQLTVRLRVRKGTLCEHLSVVVPGVGSFSPQLYRQFKTSEKTWLVPAGATGPVLVQLIGRGGGDTFISKVEAFRPDPPLSPFETGRFLPQPNLQREGRLFEIERYVVNQQDIAADTDQDSDGKWSLCRLSREENTPYFSRGTALKSDTVTADRATPADGCPPLHVRVGPLEPGRYQTYLSVPGRALAYSADGKEWRRIAGAEAAELGLLTLTKPFFEFWLDDRYVEPGNPGPTYVDFIRFMPIEDPAYTMSPAQTPKPPARGTVDRRVVKLTVANASAHRRHEPVRSGVPIPKGELADADRVRLLDASKAEAPAFVQATGRWPDGSVKWLLLDFEAEVAPKASRRFTLEYGNAVSRTVAPARLRSDRRGGSLAVDTGVARVVFDGGQFSVFLGDQKPAALELHAAEFRAADGRAWRSSLEGKAQVEIEEQNPFRATVRLRGRCADANGPGPIAFDTQVHLFAGRAELLVEYGFFATEAEPTIALAEAKLRFSGPWAGAAARFGLPSGESEPIGAAQRPRLLQTGKEVYGGAGPFPFALRDAAGQTLAAGERAPGWVRLEHGRPPALFCVPSFWQQFPKALAYDQYGLTVALWPDGEGIGPFIAHAGAGKSHRIGISLDSTASPDRWLAPLFAQAEPEWYCASGAFEELVPRRPGKYEPYEAIVDAAFDALLKDRAGYGMENWGDVWQGGYVPGAKTWSNQEWDLANNWVIPFVRTGDRRFLDFAHDAARHFADVDCIHYSKNPAFVGGAWMHAHTSLRGHQLESPNFAHAGWAEGMLNIYHLTGDRRGLEAAQGIAQYICRHAPQKDRLPPGGPPYNLMIQRPAGWPLTTLCLVYRETWDPVYLQTARRIVDYARRSQDPERGIWDAQVGHEVPYRGGCVFAYTLLRGLRLFADLTGETRAHEDYVKAARWVFGEMWRPGHKYLYEQCPLHEPGSLVPFTLSEMGGYATRLSGDPLFATIAHAALAEHSAAGRASWMTGSAAASQWGNGILQQAPRMLHDWERTGLAVDERVTLTSASSAVKVPRERPGTVKLRLANETDAAIEDLSASCLIRGDWQARVVRCPPHVAAHGAAEIELSCQAPPPLAQYELQSDLAHVHVLAQYRQGKQKMAAWGYARLEIAKPLEVTRPESVALKPGAQSRLELTVTDGVEAKPKVAISAKTELPGVSVGDVRIVSAGEGRASVTLPLLAAKNAPPATGVLTLDIRSGPRRTTLETPVKVGRFRAALIESDASAEWRYPFQALHAYPGIAIEYLPASQLKVSFPDAAEGIAARWEAVILAETGEGAAAFAPKQLAALAEFVKQGGGLMTIGGMKCYTPGGYAETPLKEILPVDLSDGAYALGDIGVEVLERKTVFFEGYDPVFPMFGAHQRLTAKPGARVLARFADGAPFAVLGEAGKGRVLCLGAIWNHGSGKAFRQWPQYGRFVGRCVRWVAKDVD